MNKKKMFLRLFRIIVKIRRITAQVYYGFEVLWYVTIRRGLKASLITPFRMIWSKLFREGRLVFALDTLSSDALSPVEVLNYKVISVTSPDMIDEALKKKFSRRQHYILDNPERLLRKGACLWIGYFNGQFAHFSCTRTGNIIGSYMVPITAESVRISHCVTFPQFRGHGLYPATLTHIVRTLGNKGFKQFYIDCWDWNAPSVRGILRVGFHLIERKNFKLRIPVGSTEGK